MTSPYYQGMAHEIKGYRIAQRIYNEDQQKDKKQLMLKIVVKNQSSGIPRIRNDVVCNGKHYPFIPLLAFTAEDDLKMVQQISAIVMRDQNEILCQILCNSVSQVKSSQFADLKLRMKRVFGLQLRVDPQQLFLILISDQISSDEQFNKIFDSISQTEFVNVIKRIYENCPNRIIPKILRRISKYFNSTKIRTQQTIQRVKRFLKLVKSAYDNVQDQQVQQKAPLKKVEQKAHLKKVLADQQSKYWRKDKVQQKISPKKQQNSTQSVPKIQQKPKKNPSTKEALQKPTAQIQVLKLDQKVIEKVAKPQNSSKNKKSSKPQKSSKIQNTKKFQKQVKLSSQAQLSEQKEQQWQDVEQESQNEKKIKDSNKKFNLHADDSDEQLRYQGPKKRNDRKNNNIVTPLDPEFQRHTEKKQQPLKKQNNYKNRNNKSTGNYGNGNGNNNRYKNKHRDQNQGAQESFDRRNNNRQYKQNNGSSNNNQQSQQRGRRQFSKDSKKVDSRIILGINGANDAIWRQKMRPPKFPKDQNESPDSNKNKYNRQNRESRGKTQNAKNESLIVTRPKDDNVSMQQSKPTESSGNLELVRVFSLPQDVQKGKRFKFQKKNYKIFVNKLFWVSITGNQLTIQKQGKGYIRTCSIEVIDAGNGIMAEGLTLNIDGMSNLEDGGVVFGGPVFQEFTPDGQWFHVTALEAYAYL